MTWFSVHCNSRLPCLGEPPGFTVLHPGSHWPKMPMHPRLGPGEGGALEALSPSLNGSTFPRLESPGHSLALKDFPFNLRRFLPSPWTLLLQTGLWVLQLSPWDADSGLAPVG